MDAIAADGFRLGDRRESLSDLALLSLRQGIRAYFSTYSVMRYSLHLFRDGSGFDQKTIDFNHGVGYWDAASETILHLQHFVELCLKRILRTEHPLLADTAASDPVVLHKLLRREALTDPEERGVRSVEFSHALMRFNRLFEAGRLDPSNQVVYDARHWMAQLNRLRNRIWHRGAFVLRYTALDRLIAGYILPFVETMTSRPPYAEGNAIWQYPPLACGVDPIEEIRSACANGSYDLDRVSFAKELGRAAYSAPRPNGYGNIFATLKRARIERVAKSELGDTNVAGVRDCPVCGCSTLVVFDDIDVMDEDGAAVEAYRYTWQVVCRMCSFEVNNHLPNPSTLGLPIDDFWKVHSI